MALVQWFNGFVSFFERRERGHNSDCQKIDGGKSEGLKWNEHGDSSFDIVEQNS